ncbi:hypothetical protein [Streptosporangium sp. NPDC006007]|uniref:hypothetical protein n=1 Tax=Streptosporangium sp. NPDC006007 TaxID=3154575 RepID=UPI0033BB86A5
MSAMCEPAPRVVYVHPAITGAGLVATVVLGSGMGLYAVAGGSTVTAWALLGLTGYSAITTIALLARRASPVRQTTPPMPARTPARTTTARVLASRTTPALPAADRLAVDAAETTTAPAHLSA